MARKGRAPSRYVPLSRPDSSLEAVLERAYNLLCADKPAEVLALLEPLRGKYPRDPSLYVSLGDAYALLQNFDRAIWAYERVIQLDPWRTDYWQNLVLAYAAMDMPVHGLRLLRRFPAAGIDEERFAAALAGLTAELPQIAERFGVDLATAEEGSYQSETGRLALDRGDFHAAVDPLRRSAELFPRWPSPRNNLALAFFYLGEPDQVLEITRSVLEMDPENVHGLSNMIRSLVFSGRLEEARPFWERLLRVIEEKEDVDIIKAAEAAAVMQEDEVVYRLLRPLFPSPLASVELRTASEHTFFLLSVAAANLGKKEEALQAWDILENIPPYREQMAKFRAALRAGQPGAGWADRYSYFGPAALLRQEDVEAFGELMATEGKEPPERFKARVQEMARRYPQLVHFAEHLIWEDEQPEVGVPILRVLGTPAAVAALQRYATSQAGPDEGRRDALMALMQMGALPSGTRIRAWLGGEWREVELRGYAVGGDREWPYAPELYDLMGQAVQLGQQKRFKEAERLYRQIIAADPNLKEAYNNLAALYSWQGKLKQGREMLERALQIDPLYVFPRCNLALTTLEEGDVKGAKQWIDPLLDKTEFLPNEMAFYQYAQARIQVAEEKYDGARELLEMALSIMPEYEPAQRLLKQLEWQTVAGGLIGAGNRLAELHERSTARSRKRIQSLLTGSSYTLQEVLNAYTRDSLVGIARNVLLGGSWAAFKKAQLVEALAGTLQTKWSLLPVVAQLSGREKAALRWVLESGGAIPAEAFRERNGDEREESPRWEHHQPTSVAGRLMARGLLAVGPLDGQEQVVVPLELRDLLPEMLHGQRRRKKR